MCPGAGLGDPLYLRASSSRLGKNIDAAGGLIAVDVLGCVVLPNRYLRESLDSAAAFSEVLLRPISAADSPNYEDFGAPLECRGELLTELFWVITSGDCQVSTRHLCIRHLGDECNAALNVGKLQVVASHDFVLVWQELHNFLHDTVFLGLLGSLSITEQDIIPEFPIYISLKNSCKLQVS